MTCANHLYWSKERKKYKKCEELGREMDARCKTKWLLKEKKIYKVIHNKVARSIKTKEDIEVTRQQQKKSTQQKHHLSLQLQSDLS